MKKSITALGLLLISSMTHAAQTANQPDSQNFIFDFHNGSQGWSADFCDYPVGEETFYELYYGFKELPAYMGADSPVLFLRSNNHSDDTCMFLRKAVHNLKPNTQYKVTFYTTIGSRATNGSVGVGGSPANSVFVKAGATLKKPVAPYAGYRRLNIDKGNQGTAGQDVQILGDVGVDNTANRFKLKTLNSPEPFRFKTDATGTAWLFFATDSGFEAVTAIYVTEFQAYFEKE